MATVQDLKTAITGEVSPFVKAQTAINARVIASLTRLEARDNFPCQLVQSSLPTGAPTGAVYVIGPGTIGALRSPAEVQALVAANLVSGHATILSADDCANLLAVFARFQ